MSAAIISLSAWSQVSEEGKCPGQNVRSVVARLFSISNAVGRGRERLIKDSRSSAAPSRDGEEMAVADAFV